MKQLTINIPDYYYVAFMEYFSHIPEATLLNESNFTLTKEHIRILDKSSATPDSDCMTKNDSNNLLRKRNGL